MNKALKTILSVGAASLLAVSSFAAGSLVTINVDPSIKILVNGEEFKPKDANGNDVMTFTYNGTTYAPLRALAEAYGLEVGYDAEKKMVTVNNSGFIAVTNRTSTSQNITITNLDSSITTELIEELQGLAVFWAPQGTKIHLDPACRSFKLGVTYAGTYDQALTVRKSGWCGWCSQGSNNSDFTTNSKATKEVLSNCYTYDDFLNQIPAVEFD